MKLKKYRCLNIKGILLDNNQLRNYIEKSASSYDVKYESDINTYPIPRLRDNFKMIEKTYRILNNHVKLGIDIHPAGEWILDNFYIVEENYKTICKELTFKKYKKHLAIANGQYTGFARSYVLATEILAYTDNKVTYENLKITIESYQKRKLLNMQEIWNLWIFLSIALIENIRNICEKIYLTSIEKYKVESIIERLVENKDIVKQKFRFLKEDKRKMKYAFIEYLSYKLKQYGKKGAPYLEILEEQVNKMGLTIDDVLTKEHFEIANLKVSIGNSIMSLKEIKRIDFLNLFEQTNCVEEILKKDPANVYLKMDYKTKEYYRSTIKEISEKSKISERYIANKVLNLAKQNKNQKAHVGYYLIDERPKLFEKRTWIKNKRKY